MIIDFVQTIAPPAAVVLAAKVATKKQIQVKVNGIEVNANSKEDAPKIIEELSTQDNLGK